MKKLILTAALVLSILFIKQADAQISISLNLNIDSQPAWGPTGYNHVEYYYLPDIDCYYYVPGNQFVYLNGSSWTRSSSLPSRYGNYDLYGAYKVVVNKPTPYLHDADYRKQYSSYKGRKGQAVIRDSKDSRYKKAANNRPQGNRPSKPSPNRPANNQKPSPSTHPTPKSSHQGNNKPDNKKDDHDKKDDQGHRN